MKYSIFIVIALFTTITRIQAMCLKVIPKDTTKSDSTIRQRFIANVLNEYEQDGRWVFVKIEQCDTKYSYEIVKPITIFKALTQTNNNLTRKMFVWITLHNLYVDKQIYSCLEQTRIYYPKANYAIEGVKIDRTKYNKLKRLSIKSILSQYFKSNKMLKQQYMSMLPELIAVCYENNVKVITKADESVIYEIFDYK